LARKQAYGGLEEELLVKAGGDDWRCAGVAGFKYSIAGARNFTASPAIAGGATTW